jgi:large subunit ribosomal protein L24
MKANRPVTMRIKKNDTVRIMAGALKGQTGKVLAVHPATSQVTIEGIGKIKRHIKPSQANPQGGTKEIHKPMSISKVALVNPANDAKVTRVGYELKKDGTKVRVARAANNKEIK